jgi:hypothetical protein
VGKGIDYGMGLANVDRETGIRFGVIPIRVLSEWAYDDFEADYGEPSCPNCGGEVVAAEDGQMTDGGPYGEHLADTWCEECEEGWTDLDMMPDQPMGHYLDKDGYQASLDEQGDVFITKSPWKTRAAFCSPCAPGACYLTSPAEDGEWAYCFGPEWFEEGSPMPYVAVKVAEEEQMVLPGVE